MSSNSNIICFALLYVNKTRWAVTNIGSCEENKQKNYKKWLKSFEMETLKDNNSKMI